MELDPGQLLLVGLIVSLLVQALKLISAWFGMTYSRTWITIIAFVVSVVVGYFFAKPELPTTGDPMELAVALIVQAGVVLGWSTLVYNIVLDKLLELLKLTKVHILKLRGYSAKV